MLHFQELSQLPADATYRFDREPLDPEEPGEPLTVQKTVNRTVRSLNFSEFQSKEVVRKEGKEDTTVVHHSPELTIIVPKGARYAYDLIARVGQKSFLEGRRLKDIQEELAQQRPSIEIPSSSLYDAQSKFLFYFGELHRRSAPLLMDYLHQRGLVTWLVDGTCEPGTPIFFAIKEAQEGIALGSWKIATENEDDIAKCLREAKQLYGSPSLVLHDLSKMIKNACERELPDVSRRTCDYHLLSDIGEELYQGPQSALSKRLRSLKLQLRLKEQRRGFLLVEHTARRDRPIGSAIRSKTPRRLWCSQS